MKELWSGNLFLILLLRAQQNEFNQTVFCMRTGSGNYKVLDKTRVKLFPNSTRHHLVTHTYNQPVCTYLFCMGNEGAFGNEVTG